MHSKMLLATDDNQQRKKGADMMLAFFAGDALNTVYCVCLLLC